MTQEERYKLLQDIVKIDTTNGNEKQIADYLQALFEKEGIPCQQIEYAPGRNQLIATLSFGTPGKTLGFSGHMDVVPAGNVQWEHPPFSGDIHDGKIHGRGTADMKSGLAALVLAMLELKQSNQPLEGTIKLLATVGEETSAIGSAQLVQKGLCEDLDALIIGEPSDLDLKIAHKGALWLRFTVYGKTAHGSMPQLGINAIDNMVKLIQSFKQKFSFDGIKDELLGAPTYSLDLINGGKATNVIPDTCTAEFDIRTVPTQNHETLIAEANALLAELQQADSNFQAEVTVINDLSSVHTNPDDPFVQLSKRSIEKVTGRTPKIDGAPAYTDASQFVKAKKAFPIVLIGAGPGMLSHQPNEYADLSLFEQCIESYKDIAGEFLKKA